MNMFLTTAKRILVYLALLMCASCTEASSTSPLQLTAYNHTAAGVGAYSVEIPGGKGTSAGFLGSGEGGGGFTCCVSVPTKWRAGMSIAVTQYSIVDGKNVETTSTVPLPEYDADNSSTLSIHFLSSGAVRAYVTPYALGHPEYPLQGKDAEKPPIQSL